MQDAFDGHEREEYAVTEADVHRWFAEQLERKDATGRRIGQRHLAKELGVHQATVSRNAKLMRQGEPLAADFYKKVRNLLVEKRTGISATTAFEGGARGGG